MVRDLEDVSVTVEKNVAIVTLDRPPVNALDDAMYTAIAETFGELAKSSADIIVLRSAGKHFCAGNDLKESATMPTDRTQDWLDHAGQAFTAIYTCSVPVIAAVQGVALGAGLQLAASCDLIVAADDARFGLPEITVGMMGGARHLARLVPWSLVRRMFYTGEPASSEDLAPFGGITQIVPADRVVDEAVAMARKIAASGPKALRFAKRSLTTIESLGVLEGYAFEASLTAELLASPESRRTMEKFLESRREKRSGD